MQDLKIHLLINPECELVAIDNTIYHNIRYSDTEEYLDDLSNHVGFEFLLDVHDDVEPGSIRIKNYTRSRQELMDGNTSVFVFSKDGTFTYYKFLIPKIEHFHVKAETSEYYKTNHQIFYYKDNIYYAEDDLLTLDEITKCTMINDLQSLWDLQGTQTLSFQKVIFSVCKLQKCLVYLQRKILDDNRNCYSCDSSRDDQYTRDFLFSALYVLDYLKDHKNYEEAQRILDNLSDCAGTLCNEYQPKSNCNCGKTIL